MLPARFPRLFASHALLGALLLAGCKPSGTPANQTGSEPPTGRQPAGSGNASSTQPRPEELAAFLRSLLPPAVGLGEVKSDPPAPLPDTSPAARAWLLNVKLVLVPAEDLLALPTPEEAQSAQALADELNALTAWRDAFARSPFARVYPPFDLQAPAATAPPLLSVRQAKGRPLPPVYGKVAAEWQVDHWRFTDEDLELPALGQPRAAFPADALVHGSPEAEAFLAAERQALAMGKEKQAAIEGRYARDLAQATRPGTLYRGQVSHPTTGVAPAELRFVETPPGDARVVAFEITLPRDPAYRYAYTARLNVPLPVGPPPKVAADPFSFTVPDRAARTGAAGSLTAGFIRGAGKDSAPGLAGNFLRGLTGNYTSGKLPLLLLDGRIEGRVAQYLNGDFLLAAQREP